MPKLSLSLEDGIFGFPANSSSSWAHVVTGSNQQPGTLGRAQLTDDETQFVTDFRDNYQDREFWLNVLIQEGSTWSQS